MSKVLKKESSPLKFDTSSANIGCFIRGNSKQKGENERCANSFRGRRRAKNDREKKMQFQDKAFLQSVVCKILNDADCEGITELIESMVFPGNNTAQSESGKESSSELIEQQQISQIFMDFHPFNNAQCCHLQDHLSHNTELIRVLPPVSLPLARYSYYEKIQGTTTLQSTIVDSLVPSPRSEQTNPEINISSMIQQGYGFGYFPQNNYLYQRQLPQRKKRTVSGQQASEYKIISDKIESDGRTTLMVRHIPNKYSQEMLYDEIGRNHKMKINFLYLPIDHYNSCNVGYAFVNFIHTKFILEFHKQFNGRRWDRFNSQKICELAYARIQGTTNLMDHFQNASNASRGRTSSKCQSKTKSSFDIDEIAINDISKIVHSQKLEES